EIFHRMSGFPAISAVGLKPAPAPPTGRVALEDALIHFCLRLARRNLRCGGRTDEAWRVDVVHYSVCNSVYHPHRRLGVGAKRPGPLRRRSPPPCQWIPQMVYGPDGAAARTMSRHDEPR